ncbi:MATE family efflux transporter [Shewanella surugensis]|uniref:Multidrug resistance protein NorM n=1 Tax=Shewanella surugensis TaxID=212020 RepID=A0ABT0LJV9_9GAMM|nr:MATE family efflux transporter [Shewanella surugensis]MCL1127740.1 hypothetical protein [Shewanella surugensis]
MSLRRLTNLLKVSLVIAGQGLITNGAFSITAIFMGMIGTIALASHQIALVCVIIGSIIPIGLSLAVTIRIGHVLGEKKSSSECLTILIGAQIMGVLFMGSVAVIFIFQGREFLIWFFTDLELIDLTTKLLVIVGAFLIFDSVQLISMGALKGYKDVYWPTVFVFAAFWLISLPLGAFLTFYLGYGDTSLWLGLALGLILCAIMLSIRFVFVYRSFTVRGGESVHLIYLFSLMYFCHFNRGHRIEQVSATLVIFTSAAMTLWVAVYKARCHLRQVLYFSVPCLCIFHPPYPYILSPVASRIKWGISLHDTGFDT